MPHKTLQLLSAQEQTIRQLVRVCGIQKHSHTQFNILTRQSLLAAQKDPESTGTWSCVLPAIAYFVGLTPSLQAERIEERLD